MEIFYIMQILAPIIRARCGERSLNPVVVATRAKINQIKGKTVRIEYK